MRMEQVPQLYFYDYKGSPTVYDIREGSELENIVSFVERHTKQKVWLY